MKKEVVLAIIVGLFIGGVITFGMYRAKQAVDSASPKPEFVAIESQTDTFGTEQTDVSQGIIINEPEDESLVRSASLRITGRTTPNASVAVLLEDSEVITFADEQGNFSATVTLVTGSNILIIRSLTDSGQTSEVSRTIVYSTNEFSDAPSVATASGKKAL